MKRGSIPSLLAATALAAASPRAALAQEEAGASFLLVPVSARSVGLGGAGVGDATGATAVIANPAAFARLAKPLAGLDYGQDDVSKRAFVVAAYPSKVLGAVAFSAYVNSLGEQPLTGDAGEVVGTVVVTDVAYAASYAARFGRRLLAGLSYKYVQYRFNCSGLCTDPTSNSKPSTTALDVGAQYDLPGTLPVHLGAELRNLGLKLQVKDRAQADPLPSQIVVGGAAEFPSVARYVPDATLRVLVDATHPFGNVNLSSTYHAGLEAAYRKTVMLRAGYAKLPGSGYGGPALGVGVASPHFRLDLAQQLGASGLLADRAPTYVGLHYSF